MKKIFQKLSLIFIVPLYFMPSTMAQPSIWRKLMHEFNFSFGVEPSFIDHTINIINKKMLLQGNDLYIIDHEEYYLTRFLYNSYKKALDFEIDLEKDLESMDQVDMTISGQNVIYPIYLGIHTDIAKRLRIGFRTRLCVHTIKKLSYTFYDILEEEHKKNYLVKKPTTYSLAFLAQLGFIFYNSTQYRFLLEYNGGISLAYTRLKDIHYKQQKNNYYAYNFIHKISMNIEKKISSCVSLSFKPHYEFPFIFENSLVKSNKTAVILSYKKFGIEFGITICPPLLPRCKTKYCHIEKDHIHNKKIFRGISIFKGKDKYGNFNYTS